MTRNSKNQSCPYFSQKQGGACLIIKGGLYIPLHGHIASFCTTPDYTTCQQYSTPASQNRTAPKDITSEADSRRRFRRMKNTMPVALYTCDEKGQPVSALDDSAITLDIGMGGMKISSRKEIKPHMMVAFKFADDYLPSTLTGVGEVRWTKPQPDSSSFQAGLSFTDSAVPAALGNRFALS